MTASGTAGSVMVTGGLGFVGRHLVGLLADEGRLTVSYNRDYSESKHPAIVAVQGELFDIPRLVRTMQEHDVRSIVHTAAMSHPVLSIELPLTTFAANVDGTVCLFEAARLAGVERIVNFSSECAYGPQDDEIVREDARLRPSTPYAVTKVTTELLGDVYRERYGLEVVSLRVTVVYGPGNTMPEPLGNMLGAAVRGERYELERGGEHRFQYVHVRDVAQAARAALFAESLGQAGYNVSGEVQTTIAEVAELVRRVVPGAELAVGDGYFSTLDRQGCFDISAAKRDLGFRPSWTLEEGVRDYAGWLKDAAATPPNP